MAQSSNSNDAWQDILEMIRGDDTRWYNPDLNSQNQQGHVTAAYARYHPYGQNNYAPPQMPNFQDQQRPEMLRNFAPHPMLTVSPTIETPPTNQQPIIENRVAPTPPPPIAASQQPQLAPPPSVASQSQLAPPAPPVATRNNRRRIPEVGVIDLTGDDDEEIRDENRFNNNNNRRPTRPNSLVDIADSPPSAADAQMKRAIKIEPAEELTNVAGPSGCSSNQSAADKSCLSLMCPVCLDGFEMIKMENQRQLLSTRCGHIFCDACMNDIMKEQKHCPTCRKSIRRQSLHPIFL